jgi:hypothetical protein
MQTAILVQKEDSYFHVTLDNKNIGHIEKWETCWSWSIFSPTNVNQEVLGKEQTFDDALNEVSSWLKRHCIAEQIVKEETKQSQPINKNWVGNKFFNDSGKELGLFYKVNNQRYVWRTNSLKNKDFCQDVAKTESEARQCIEDWSGNNL